MKLSFKILTAAALTTASTGCSSFLDVNTNPNSLTPSAVTPNFILATALATTASTYASSTASTQNSLNAYASWAADYWGRAGGVNGYGEETTYTYSNTFYQGAWNSTYDNLNDYNIIQTQGKTGGYPNHAAIAQIMKVFNFQLLVDEWGDIPYTNALKGNAGSTTPTYDKAADIYRDFIVQLDGAIADINAAAAVTGSRTVGGEDIVFGGNMTQWKRFANSLKLRILLRQSQTNNAELTAYVRTQLSALQNSPDGFITTDVVAQPGYTQNTNQQSPFYTRFGATAAGAQATERFYQIPTNYILNQYTRNNDPRVSQLYSLGVSATGPAYVGTDLGERSPASFTAVPTASSFRLGGGLLKGPTAPTPIMLLADQLFSKAEAETRGLFTGGDAAAKTDFQNGILASFTFYYRPATIAVTNSTAGVTEYNTYIAANTANPLVNYDLATANGALGKQAVIIYQKYLAMNSVTSTEGWADYRRTAQPKIMASTQSTSSRADKLPTRLLYPLTEVSTNAANIPAGVTQFTPIFWDVVD
ncbi:SusD/RagB family nutrient-binding outer membrane lipoprotein [Hymenobacter arcticus]